MSGKRFTKIGSDAKKGIVTIHSEEKADKTVTESHLTCLEEPSQAFRDALQALRAHVIAICECPPEWETSLTTGV